MNGTTPSQRPHAAAPSRGVRFMWMEITGRCQLRCTHCYADSGPEGGHGTMTITDWKRVIDEAAVLGVRMVQFIGGEPTLHPALAVLVDHALARDLEVEVFTNLVHVTPRLWETFSRPGVRLATSWYSDDPVEHVAITGRRSHARTRAGITGPECYLLDWEGWGMAPAGYDAATLYCHSLLVPGVAARVRAEFAEELDTPDGVRAQLLVVARMLGRSGQGDYPELVLPLHRLANELTGR